MLNFELSFDFSKLEKNIQEKIQRTTTLRPAMQVIAQDMLKEVQLNFRGEKTPEGEKWIPSQRAIRDKGKTLRDKGLLQKSIGAKFNNVSAKVGTNIPYAAIHQFGSEGLPNGVISIKERKRQNTFYNYNEKKGTLKRSSKRRANFVYTVGINVSPYGVAMPARQYLGINYLQRKRYERVILNYLLYGKVVIK